MKLWKRASGALKDKNSIFLASLSRRNSPWSAEFEVVVIKATSHDHSKLDFKNTKRVFAWLHTSPAYLGLLLSALSRRIQKTCSWVVALKGLMLIHGVLRCNIPSVKTIGRLPFDLSNFGDGKNSCFDEFVRSYFAFLDQRSTCLYVEQKEEDKEKESAIVRQLLKLQQWQELLGMLFEIRPNVGREMNSGLIYDAMDCIIIEMFSIHNRICNGLAQVLTRIHADEKIEAATALEILQKALQQGEQVNRFLDFCRDIGVFNASKFPRAEDFPQRDIQKLEQIINGCPGKQAAKEEQQKQEQNLAMVVKRCEKREEEEEPKCILKTIITEKWEVFDDDPESKGIDIFNLGKTIETIETIAEHDPFAEFWDLQTNPYIHNGDLPDLISFL